MTRDGGRARIPIAGCLIFAAVLAVAFVAATVLVVAAFTSGGGPPFHARISRVAGQRICYVALDAPSDTPGGRSWCGPISDLFYSRRPIPLAVGDCVVLALHHPVIELERKVAVSHCAARQPG